MRKVERALQIWQVLLCAAHNRQVLTYELLADIIGVDSNPLDDITVLENVSVVIKDGKRGK